jgi:hypothetical protein
VTHLLWLRSRPAIRQAYSSIYIALATLSSQPTNQLRSIFKIMKHHQPQ